MIENSLSRSGLRIASQNGRFFCSRVDPEAEAIRWMDLHASRIENSASIVIIGLGCGYHVTELRKKFPQKKVTVLVGEGAGDREIISQFERMNPLDFAAVEIIILSSSERITSKDSLARLVLKSYSVLLFSPALADQWAWAREVQNFLLGRDVPGADWLINVRGISQRSLFSESPCTLTHVRDSLAWRRGDLPLEFMAKINLLCELVR